MRRAGVGGVALLIPAGLDDAELERWLFAVADAGASERRAIDWAAIQRELKRRGVTLALLWQEYLADHPNGYSSTRFCELYAAWRKQVSPTMRQTHLAGEKLFVDWAGDMIAVVDPAATKMCARRSVLVDWRDHVVLNLPAIIGHHVFQRLPHEGGAGFRLEREQKDARRRLQVGRGRVPAPRSYCRILVTESVRILKLELAV